MGLSLREGRQPIGPICVAGAIDHHFGVQGLPARLVLDYAPATRLSSMGSTTASAAEVPLRFLGQVKSLVLDSL